MSLTRIPFQSVNDRKIEAIVGIQTSPTCSNVGIPSIAATTQRSRPSNCRSRRAFEAASDAGALGAWGGGIGISADVATAAPVSLRAGTAPAGDAGGRVRRQLP